MLNSTKIIRFIEKKLGYKFTELELDSDEILENIIEETLPLFSKYFPYQVKTSINNELDRVEGEGNIYYLKSDLEIININRVISNDLSGMGYSTTIQNRSISGPNLDPISIQLSQNINSISKNPLTFDFMYPNKIRINSSYNSLYDLLIIMNCVHPDHFGTIPVNLQEYFLKLALYDTQEALYQIRHRFSNMQTTYGNLELFIDDLQNATDKKEDMLEKFLQSSIKGANRKKLFIY